MLHEEPLRYRQLLPWARCRVHLLGHTSSFVCNDRDSVDCGTCRVNYGKWRTIKTARACASRAEDRYSSASTCSIRAPYNVVTAVRPVVTFAASSGGLPRGTATCGAAAAGARRDRQGLDHRAIPLDSPARKSGTAIARTRVDEEPPPDSAIDRSRATSPRAAARVDRPIPRPTRRATRAALVGRSQRAAAWRSGNVTRSFGPISSSDSAPQPLGAVAAGAPIRLRLWPGKARAALRETWRIWLDLDGGSALRRRRAGPRAHRHGSSGARAHPRRTAASCPARSRGPHGGGSHREGRRRRSSRPASSRKVVPPRSPRPSAASGTLSVDDASLEVAPGRHHLVQFRRLPTSDERQALAAQGIVLLGYVPERTFWTRVSASAAEQRHIETAGGLVLARPAPAPLKIAAELTQLEAMGGSETVAVHFFADATPLEIAAAKALLGAAEPAGARPLRDADATARTHRAAGRARSRAVDRTFAHDRDDPFGHRQQGSQRHAASKRALRTRQVGRKSSRFSTLGWVDWDHPDLAGRVFYDPTLKRETRQWVSDR